MGIYHSFKGLLGVGVFLGEVIFLSSPVLATSYYVSPSGNDVNTGTTLTAPFRTIIKALGVAVSGDIVYLRGGTYPEKISFPRSGSAGLPITVSGYGSETAIIDGTGISIPYGDALVKISGKQYITVTKLTVQDSSYFGVYITSYNGVQSQYIELSGLSVLNTKDAAIKTYQSAYLTLRNNSTRESGSSGIGVWQSDRVLVDRNTVVNARNRTLADGGHEESISLASTTNFEVSNNEVYTTLGFTAYLGNEGIDVKESSRYGKVHHNYIHDFVNEGGGLYIDGWKAGLPNSSGVRTPTLSNIDVYNNHLARTGAIAIAAEEGGTVENIDIYNNVIHDVHAVGIAVTERVPNDPNVPPGPIRNINIFNNSIYKAQWNGGGGIFIKSNTSSPITISNVVIRNNVVSFNNYNGVIRLSHTALTDRVSADHNISYHPNTSQIGCSVSGPYPNCVEITNVTTSTIHDNYWTNPLFVSTSTPDLHLSSTSPGINKGVSIALVTNDYDGKSRPIGSFYDIGAYEYGTSNTPSPTTESKTGDLDHDGDVDIFDYNALIGKFGQYDCTFNITGNCAIDIFDYNLLIQNFGPFALQGAFIPGPPKEELVVFDLSLRMPGSPEILATPYTEYLYHHPVSTGERIAMEIKEAVKKRQLDVIVT